MTGAPKKTTPRPAISRVRSKSKASAIVVKAVVREAQGPVVVAGVVPILFLDTNVLIPQYLRLVFLELAEARLIQVHWTEDILIEMRRNLIEPDGHYRLKPGTVDRMLAQMRKFFPQALVQGHEKLKARFVGKTDAKDEHVAAGALKRSLATRGAETVVLVTSNMIDLPQSAFAGTKVLIARPGRFLTELLANAPEVAEVIDSKLRALTTPHTSCEDFLLVMDNSQCPTFADALAEVWGLSPSQPAP